METFKVTITSVDPAFITGMAPFADCNETSLREMLNLTKVDDTAWANIVASGSYQIGMVNYEWTRPTDSVS